MGDPQSNQLQRDDIPAGFRFLHKLRGHKGPIRAIAWSPAGAALASGSDDETICLWDGMSDPKILKSHFGPVRSLTWSPNGEKLAVLSPNSFIGIIDREHGKLLTAIQGIATSVTSIAWSPNDQLIALASARIDSIVRLFHTDSGDVYKNIKTHHGPVYPLLGHRTAIHCPHHQLIARFDSGTSETAR